MSLDLSEKASCPGIKIRRYSGYPIEGAKVEQVKSIDFRARRSTRIGKASQDLLEEVLAILDACIYRFAQPFNTLL